MIKLLIFFLVTVFPPSVVTSTKLICNGTNILEVTPSDLIFFETPNIPEFMAEECTLQFYLNSAIYDIKRLNWWLFFTNQYSVNIDVIADNVTTSYYDGSILPFYSYDGISNLTIKSYTPGGEGPPVSDKNYFQGYIYIEEQGYKCQYEEITRINPFAFSDETEILWFQSDSDINKCIWNFISPRGYEFKFVLFLYERYSNDTFLTMNGHNGYTMILEPPLSRFANRKYEIDTNQLTITFENPTTSYFTGYLTIVKRRPSIISLNCPVTKNSNGTIFWSNMNPILNGYPNNAECWYNFTVPAEKQIVVQILKETMIENGCDRIIHYTQNGEHIYTTEVEMIFQAQRNGYNSFASFHFVSDGSVQNPGFNISFIEQGCECNSLNIIIPCDISDDFSSNIYHIGKNGREYCGNMNCLFTLTMNQTCSKKDAVIELHTSYADAFGNFPHSFTFYDYFRIISNGTVILSSKVNISIEDAFIAFLPNNQIHQFEFVSVPYSQERQFWIVFTVAEEFKIYQRVTLTSKLPYFILEYGQMPDNSFITVELDESLKNQTLEVWANTPGGYLYRLLVFEGKDFSKFVDTNELFKSYTKYGKSFKPKDNKIKIGKYYQPDFIESHFTYLYFRIKHSDCVFQDTIFKAFYDNYDSNLITMLSHTSKSCEIIIMDQITQFNFMNNIFTTAKEENCQIYAGFEKLLILEFNATTALQLKNVEFSSEFFTIVIPPATSIALTLMLPPPEIVIPYSYKSIWYITENENYYFSSIPYNISPNITLKFTITKLNLANDSVIDFLNSFDTTAIKNITSATKIGTSYKFSNITLNIHYRSNNEKRNHDSAILAIDSIQN